MSLHSKLGIHIFATPVGFFAKCFKFSPYNAPDVSGYESPSWQDLQTPTGVGQDYAFIRNDQDHVLKAPGSFLRLVSGHVLTCEGCIKALVGGKYLSSRTWTNSIHFFLSAGRSIKTLFGMLVRSLIALLFIHTCLAIPAYVPLQNATNDSLEAGNGVAMHDFMGRAPKDVPMAAATTAAPPKGNGKAEAKGKTKASAMGAGNGRGKGNGKSMNHNLGSVNYFLTRLLL